MKIAAITAEFNPLHNGHLRLFSAVKDKLTPDIIIVLLGGDFTQRGDLALSDKYTRAKHAILAGADAVLELPQIFACSCAERFADSAVKILSSIRADERFICFGSECGELSSISNAASILNAESVSMTEEIKANLDMGCSYPVARAQALLHYAEENNLPVADPTLPNNILAIEYVRSAFNRRNVTPFTLKRVGKYHSDTLDAEAPSASAIRQAIYNGVSTECIKKDVPSYVFADLLIVSQADKLSPIALYKLMTMSPEGLKRINDVSEGIENRILRLAKESKNLQELIKNVSTKRYTEARISRIIASALLGITKPFFESEIQSEPYYKVLAVKKSKTDILSLLSHSGKVITGETEAKESDNPSAMIDALAHDIFAIAKESPDLENGMLLV